MLEEHLGRRVRTVRLDRGMTQLELAAPHRAQAGRKQAIAPMDQETYVPRRIEDVEIQAMARSLDSVLLSSGTDVAREIMERLRAHATVSGIDLPFSANTPTPTPFPRASNPFFPGDQQLERRIKSLIRWNALAMSSAPIASSTTSAATSPPTPPPPPSTKSASTISSARAPVPSRKATPFYFQGHAAPGIYARAFLEGRLSVEQL